jgi:outer membrane protein assembly factor BamA
VGRGLVLAAIALVAAVGWGAETIAPGARVTRIDIAGNVRVEEEAIRVHLRSQVGQPFDQEIVDGDIRAVYGMGFSSPSGSASVPSSAP